MNQTEAFVKLLIIGDSGVGKSCILMRFAEDRYTEAFYNTIGVDFKTKQMMVGNKRCKLQIWDTAGQQRFRTITANYYKGANGIMMVFDVTNEESFKNLDFWLDEIQKNGSTNCQKILVGNKVDLSGKRVVSQQRAEKYAKKNGLNYVQVSACNSQNINLIFQTVVKNILIGRQNLQNNVKERKNQVLILKIHQTIRSAKRDNKIAVVEKYMSKCHLQIIQIDVFTIFFTFLQYVRIQVQIKMIQKINLAVFYLFI